jgi:hypothetical protein
MSLFLHKNVTSVLSVDVNILSTVLLQITVFITDIGNVKISDTD